MFICFVTLKIWLVVNRLVQPHENVKNKTVVSLQSFVITPALASHDKSQPNVWIIFYGNITNLDAMWHVLAGSTCPEKKCQISCFRRAAPSRDLMTSRNVHKRKRWNFCKYEKRPLQQLWAETNTTITAVTNAPICQFDIHCPYTWPWNCSEHSLYQQTVNCTLTTTILAMNRIGSTHGSSRTIAQN